MRPCDQVWAGMGDIVGATMTGSGQIRLPGEIIGVFIEDAITGVFKGIVIEGRSLVPIASVPEAIAVLRYLGRRNAA